MTMICSLADISPRDGYMRVILTFFKVCMEFIKRGSSCLVHATIARILSCCAVSAREFASDLASQRMLLCLLTNQGVNDT